MPKEIKYLAFSHEEVLSALVDFRRTQSGGALAGQNRKIVIAEDNGQVIAKISVQRDRECNPAGYVFDHTTILSALILFCRNHGIPLPAKAGKTIEVTDCEVALIATMNFTQMRPDTKGNRIIYTDDELEAAKSRLEPLG